MLGGFLGGLRSRSRSPLSRCRFRPARSSSARTTITASARTARRHRAASSRSRFSAIPAAAGRRRPIQSVLSAGAAAGRILQGAAAAQARYAAGHDRHGDRRHHGRLARLRARGSAVRYAGRRRGAQHPADLGPRALRRQERFARMVGRRQGRAGQREAERHRDHARSQRPAAVPRQGAAEIVAAGRASGAAASSIAEPRQDRAPTPTPPSRTASSRRSPPASRRAKARPAVTTFTPTNGPSSTQSASTT